MTLRQLRIKAGLTQAEAARREGVNLRTWQGWEAPADRVSHRTPPADVLHRIMPPGTITARWVDESGQLHEVNCVSVSLLKALL